jgi:hypothetical protein
MLSLWGRKTYSGTVRCDSLTLLLSSLKDTPASWHVELGRFAVYNTGEYR